MMIQIADRMEHVHSDIRGPLYREALKMQAEGLDVMKLNTGNPGAFGFPLPESIRSAMQGSDAAAVPYCDFQGMLPARRAIADYCATKGIEGVEPDDVFIGNGVSEVVSFALTPLLNPGDEVLVPTPNYTLWSNTIRICGAVPVYYRCDEQAGWNPDVNDIRQKINARTRALVIINPNNPTGALYDTQAILDMLQVAREHNLVVFSDEIYDRLVLDGREHVATASLAPDLTVVTMNGLSKSHSLCGYRCGWMVLSGPRADAQDYRSALVQLTSMRLCANALMQAVIPAALHDMETPSAMVRPGGRIYEQRAATLGVLDTIEGLTYVKNSAAFYLFPKLDVKRFNITDDGKFAQDLLHATRILVVPGSGFDYPEPDHFRLVMLPQADQLREAMQRMGEFLHTYKQA